MARVDSALTAKWRCFDDVIDCVRSASYEVVQLAQDLDSFRASGDRVMRIMQHNNVRANDVS